MKNIKGYRDEILPQWTLHSVAEYIRSLVLVHMLTGEFASLDYLKFFGSNAHGGIHSDVPIVIKAETSTSSNITPIDKMKENIYISIIMC